MSTERSGHGKSQAFLTALLLLLFVLLLAACGEGKGEGTPAGTATSGAAATAARTAASGASTPAAEVPGISDTEIVLGADVVLAGAMGAVYATIPHATEAYFKYINDTQGGVCGRKIVYKLADNEDDPAKGLEAVRRLVEQDKVFAIVGSLSDWAHAAVWEYLNKNGVPDILLSAGTHMFGADPEGHPWTVQMIPSHRIEATFFGRYISENMPGKKVAVLYPSVQQGLDHLQGVKDGLDPQKNEIVAEQSYEITAISINSQVANMKAAGAEVVTTVAEPGFSSQAIKEADRLGWHPQWLMSYINADDMMFSFVTPSSLLNGAITFQALKLADWRDDPAVAKHYELMQKYGGPSPTNFTIYAQALAEVAVEALKRSCDNLTREGLMEAVESIQDFRSDLMLDDVTVSFSDTDHTGLQSGHMLRAVVDQNGKGKFEYFGPLYEFR